MSVEFCQNLSKRMKNRVFSEEHRKRISEKAKLRTGSKNPMFGIKRPDLSERNRQRGINNAKNMA